MSTTKVNNYQIGQSATATNNCTWYQPTTPDGTVRLGRGDAGATTSDIITVNSDGSVTFSGSVSASSFVGAGLILQSVQTANFTAVAGNAYPVNTTSGAVTMTLPASPTAGQQINVFDYAGTAATNAITVNPNGGKINGGTGSAYITTTRASVTLIYVDSTQGWVDITIGNAAYIPRSYTLSYLIIGGGGSGGKGTPAVCWGGGGGGGGLQNSTYTVTPGTNYAVVVGAGGAGSTSAGATANGNSSSAFGVTAGGGLGGNAYPYGWGGNSGTPQSNSGYHQSGVNPGGGGASAANVGSSVNGANGASNSITGSTVYYTGGGGSGGDTGINGSGGLGGGGTGVTSGGTPTSGSANTGGGGGGMRGDDPPAAGSGGSGVVILSVPTVNYSGTTTGSPTVTTSGSNTILTFTSSGSYTA